MPQTYDVIIIGSGPAGYTAAIYTARANMRTLVLQGQNYGGQLMLTTDVENYPGFEHGILGPEMMDIFERQARRFGPEMRAEDAAHIDFSHRPFAVTIAGDPEPVYGETLILATGAEALWLGLPKEQDLRNHGVSACAVCDGAFFKQKDLVVVGGGDTAMEDASFLTRYARHVTLVHRRDALRASKIMQRRVRENPKIDLRLNTVVEEIVGKKIEGAEGTEGAESVVGVILRDLQSGERQKLDIGGLFVAIGHRPNTDLFRGAIDLDTQGYIKPVHYTMTNVPGVFAAGDVSDHRYRQAVTAAGSGCMAALDAERWLEEHRAGE